MSKNPLIQFRQEVIKRAISYQKNRHLQQAIQNFHNELITARYPYNFFWLGVPVIQIPQELQALQEIIWEVKPDLIIETGIAYGGSIIFSASMLAILEVCGDIKKGDVIGIEIHIIHKKAILAHPLSEKITMFEGSSVDDKIIKCPKKQELLNYMKKVENSHLFLENFQGTNQIIIKMIYLCSENYLVMKKLGFLML